MELNQKFCFVLNFFDKFHLLFLYNVFKFKFRLIWSIEVNLKVDEWESMMLENESLLEHMKKEIPKLEDMQIHNWQGMAIGALRETGEA